MKWLLLIPVWLYWKLVPARKRKRCLFKESCSCHVYRITKENGLVAGLKALRKRIRQCRPGYKVVRLENGEEFLWLRDGSVMNFANEAKNEEKQITQKGVVRSNIIFKHTHNLLW